MNKVSCFLPVFPLVIASSCMEGRQGDGSAIHEPNVIFIFTDDQNHDWIGYRNPLVVTPNLDRIAAKGVIIENAFITLPVCSPSRATALTGRHNLTNGVSGYGTPLTEEEFSFAHFFNQAGYLTAMVGKWHIPGHRAKNLGFEEVRQLGGGAPYWNPPVIENEEERVYKGFSTDYCVEQTMEIISRAERESKPFAIWLCTQAPHGRRAELGGFWISDEVRDIYAHRDFSKVPLPDNLFDDLSGKPPYLKTYRGKRLGDERNVTNPGRFRNKSGVFGQITEMDRSLGQLFDFLEESGLNGNTYIVFMSDNGVFSGMHGLTSKGLLYDAVVRVPMFVTGPGIEPGRRDNATLVSNVDIAPTILDLAGIDYPDNMHGLSLKNLLLENEPLEREYLFLELPDENPTLETKPAFALRSLEWKYIRTFEDGRDNPYTFEELYHLKNDPHEVENLAGMPAHQDLVRAFRAELDSKLERVSR